MIVEADVMLRYLKQAPPEFRWLDLRPEQFEWQGQLEAVEKAFEGEGMTAMWDSITPDRW